MNNSVLNSLLTSLVTAALGGVIAKLGLDTETTAQIIGSIVAIIGAGVVIVWKAAMHSSNAVISAAAKLPEVQQIVLDDPAKAKAIPSDKVVPGNAP